MKRKVAFLVGYNGSGFHGLQWNKNTHTIEKIFMDLLFKNNLISEMNSTDAKKIDLKSSSRTDKGVHAVFNVISAKITQEPTDELTLSLREQFLEHGIYIYKILRVTKAFLGHKAARSRIYKYFVPTFFLKESNFEEDFMKRIQEDSVYDNKSQIEKSIGQSRKESCFEPVKETKQADNLEDKRNNNNNNEEDFEEQLLEISSEKIHEIKREYKISDIEEIFGYRTENIDLFRELMKKYEGTKNYKNFTILSNKLCKSRYIKEIQVSDPFVVEDIEYVEILIHGQSFLLHQIRKMISFGVLNCKYSKKKALENFKRVFEEEIHVPKSPSPFLYLRYVFFNDYNQHHEKKLEVGKEECEVFEKKIKNEVFKKENLLEWLKFFDSVLFHHDKFEILKK